MWRADLGAVPDELEELLCGSERARAKRLLSERHRRNWALSRSLLRALTSRYLDTAPGALRFTAGPHGKLALVEEDLERGLSFNLSRSGSLALYAFSRLGAVGVDVEVARRPLEEVAIAARVLGEDVARGLRAIADANVRRHEFLRAWTRHEAVLKCSGAGIGGDAPHSGGRAPWLLELELGLGPCTAGALACEREPDELRCWTWS